MNERGLILIGWYQVFAGIIAILYDLWLLSINTVDVFENIIYIYLFFDTMIFVSGLLSVRVKKKYILIFVFIVNIIQLSQLNLFDKTIFIRSGISVLFSVCNGVYKYKINIFDFGSEYYNSSDFCRQFNLIPLFIVVVIMLKWYNEKYKIE